MKMKAQIMDEAALGRALMRISHEINEHNRGVDNVVLVGVRRRGEPIAQRIRGNIHKIEEKTIPCGSLDIRFYRDDLSHLADQPETRPSPLPFDVTDKDVVLCDDVIYTGRTARAAIEAIFALGRPRTAPSSWPCWSTAATASCPSAPTMSARTSPPRAARWWRSACRSSTARRAYI